MSAERSWAGSKGMDGAPKGSGRSGASAEAAAWTPRTRKAREQSAERGDMRKESKGEISGASVGGKR
jgi:hypothetical protein